MNNNIIALSNGYTVNRLSKYLIIMYTLAFLLTNTIVGLYLESWLERSQVLIGLCFIFLFLIKFYAAENKIKVLKYCSFILIYFAIRVICFVYMGMEYTTARTIFFEGIYLLIFIPFFTEKIFYGKAVMNLLIWLNLVLNIFNMAIVTIYGFSNENLAIRHFISEYTYINLESNKLCALYINPNTYGIMTAFAIVISSIIYMRKAKTNKEKILFVLYLMFSLWCVYLSDCRSAEVGLACVFTLFFVDKVVNFRNKKRILCTSLILFSVITFLVFGYIKINSETGLYNFTTAEYKIDRYSSNRYYIWKSAFYAHSDNLFLGVGNQNKEIEDRDEYLYNLYESRGYDIGKYEHTQLGLHNGYFSMIYCTGFLGFLLFFFVVIQRIIYSKIENKNNWYLTIIFIFLINFFESTFIVSRFFLCLYMFLILAMDEDEEVEHDKTVLEVK